MIYARVRLGKYLSERYEVACGGRLVAGGGIFSGQEFVGMRECYLGSIELVGWRRCCDCSVVLTASEHLQHFPNKSFYTARVPE